MGYADLACARKRPAFVAFGHCTLVALALGWSPLADARQMAGVENVQIVARLTGPGSLNHTNEVAIGGTDLGSMVNHQGRTYFLFGDTFSGDTPTQGGFWRNNAMAYSSDRDPSDGVPFDGWITDDRGQARQVIRSGRTSPIREIPTGAISIGDRIYAWYMAANWWGPPGQWTANYSGLAYRREGDQEFTIVDDFAFPGNGSFGMVTASFRTDLAPRSDDKLYVSGTPAGRLGGVKLARVDPDQVGQGTFAIQSHDPGHPIFFRNRRVQSIPEPSGSSIVGIGLTFAASIRRQSSSSNGK